MNIIDSSMKTMHKLNPIEVGMYELYLSVATLLLCIWFPVLISASFVLYIVLLIIYAWIFFSHFFPKKHNVVKKLQLKWIHLHLFKKLDYIDIAAYKTMVSLCVIILAKLFPVLLTAHIAWYVGLTGLWAGYFLGKIVGNK